MELIIQGEEHRQFIKQTGKEYSILDSYRCFRDDKTEKGLGN